MWPDIVYRDRDPGPSAVDCVEAAVKEIAAQAKKVKGNEDLRKVATVSSNPPTLLTTSRKTTPLEVAKKPLR